MEFLKSCLKEVGPYSVDNITGAENKGSELCSLVGKS